MTQCYSNLCWAQPLHIPQVRADYLGSGAVFPTSTKECISKGTEGLQRMRQYVAEAAAEHGQAPVPFVAIGGVKVDNAAQCLSAGADGLAVVSGLLDCESAADVKHRAEQMRAAVDKCRGAG